MFITYLFARVGCEQTISSQCAYLLQGCIDGLFEPLTVATVVYRIIRRDNDELAISSWKFELVDLAIDVRKPLKRSWRIIGIDLSEITHEQVRGRLRNREGFR
jgi:hypothetical protein